MSTARTVGDWLASRTPAPPHLLRARITAALGGNGECDIAETEAVCLAAAERVLVRLFRDSFAKRGDAP
ncbi:MAG: hypothetical protein M3125_05155, partial [Gemmatimonadota bacterium]|nr:hypothetical protein [Gemmatimonadota bacterium]